MIPKGQILSTPIAMDVGLVKDQADLVKRELLFGIVAYAAGSIGDEPIKSQGHIHASSKTCQMSTPEGFMKSGLAKQSFICRRMAPKILGVAMRFKQKLEKLSSFHQVGHIVQSMHQEPNV